MWNEIVNNTLLKIASSFPLSKVNGQAEWLLTKDKSIEILLSPTIKLIITVAT